MASRLPVPCVASTSAHGEITLAVAEHDAESIRISSRHGHREVERPLRMLPLSDALSELIDELLTHDTDVSTSALQAHDTDALETATIEQASQASTLPATLVHALLDHSGFSASSLRTASGVEIMVDPHFHSAWVPVPANELSRELADEALSELQSVGLGTFQSRTGRGGCLYPVQVEQLCWLSTGRNPAPPALQRWLDDDNAALRLKTWPNLSLQDDYLQWLPVLMAMWKGPVTIAHALQQLADSGVEAQRARRGLALLCLFRHAHRDASADNVIQLSERKPAMRAEATANAEHNGLLNRFRKRLRAMLG